MRRRVVVVAALLAVAGTAACGSVIAPGEDPESARARVTADVPLLATVITSSDFEATRTSGGGASVDLLTSDTVTDSLPYDRSHDISDSGRFYVTVRAADTAGVPVTLQAFVNGTERFRRTVPVGDQELTFIFRSR